MKKSLLLSKQSEASLNIHSTVGAPTRIGEASVVVGFGIFSILMRCTLQVNSVLGVFFLKSV